MMRDNGDERRKRFRIMRAKTGRSVTAIGTACALMLLVASGVRAGTYTFANANKDGLWSDTSTNGWNAADYPRSRRTMSR